VALKMVIKGRLGIGVGAPRANVGCGEGRVEGNDDGVGVGWTDGAEVRAVGVTDGAGVGCDEGRGEGAMVGSLEGRVVGAVVGGLDGSPGPVVGTGEGTVVG